MAQRLFPPRRHRIIFDVTNHPTRLHVIEALRGNARLPHADPPCRRLLRSGRSTCSSPVSMRPGVSFDQETMEKLFGCARPNQPGRGPRRGDSGYGNATSQEKNPNATRRPRSAARWSRTTRTSTRRARSSNDGPTTWCSPPRRRSWTPRSRSRPCRRQARQVDTLSEQHEIQEKIRKLERQQRRQRQEIFKVEDEIIEKRDQLIDSLERRLAQRIETETLFTIRWSVE